MLGIKVFVVNEKGEFITDPRHACPGLKPRPTIWRKGKLKTRKDVKVCSYGLHMWSSNTDIKAIYSTYRYVKENHLFIGIVKGEGERDTKLSKQGAGAKIAFTRMTLIKIVGPLSEYDVIDKARKMIKEEAWN